ASAGEARCRSPRRSAVRTSGASRRRARYLGRGVLTLVREALVPRGALAQQPDLADIAAVAVEHVGATPELGVPDTRGDLRGRGVVGADGRVHAPQVEVTEQIAMQRECGIRPQTVPPRVRIDDELVDPAIVALVPSELETQ